MNSLIFVVGAVAGLMIIWRYATKKVSSTGGKSRVVVGIAPGHVQRQRATLGTVIAVNVICLIGLIVTAIVGASVDSVLLRMALGVGSLIFFPVIAFKVLESQDPGNRFSLFGSLAAFCIVFWLFGTMWYIGDAINLVQSLSDG